MAVRGGLPGRRAGRSARYGERSASHASAFPRSDRRLGELEDEVFDFGDRWKGSLFISSTPTADQCPECAAHLQSFQYRFYDLEMQVCPNQHGYWLEADEDSRVLELMKREEADLQRKLLAEDKWAATLRHMRSGSFFSKMRDLFQK